MPFNTFSWVTVLYFLIVIVPVFAWVKYEFLPQVKNTKSGKQKPGESGALLGVVLLSFLAAHLIYIASNSFKGIPAGVLFSSAAIALVPVIVWVKFVYMKRLRGLKTKGEKRRELWFLIIIFILGTLTVPLLSIFYEYINTHPSLDYYAGLSDLIVGPKASYLEVLEHGDPLYNAALLAFEKAENIYNTITIVIDAWLEEIVKLSLLLFFLRINKLVKSIGDAIAFSVLAGLGFAFIENIIFFTDIYLDPAKSNIIFLNVVIFRSIVLSVGHMTFSGIFGYFYGLSKFGMPVYEEQKWEGRKFPIARVISAIFGISMHRAFSIALFAEGMILAMLTHAAFNSFLGFGIRDYAVYLVIACSIYVYYLTQRKAGHLALASLGKKRMSMMAPKDEDVVLELAGMWINEGKYKEVEEICERLEKKDPDNAVVKLLFAKAHDRRRMKRAKLAFASLFFQEDIFEEDVSIFEQFKRLKAVRERTAMMEEQEERKRKKIKKK